MPFPRWPRLSLSLKESVACSRHATLFFVTIKHSRASGIPRAAPLPRPPAHSLLSMSNHFDAQGQPHMVDVSAKPQTVRVAVAEGLVSMAAATLQAIRQTEIRKGDVLAVARLAAIGATKQTANLIPLCHAIPVEAVTVDFDFPGCGEIDEQQPATGASTSGASTSGESAIGQVRCQVTVRTTARTGVEMEALTAVAVAGLTIYDMCKSIDRSMELGPIRLLNKSGGQSGDFQRTAPNP